MARFTTEVVENEEGSWDAVCNDTALDEPCFRSTEWANEEEATTRIAEHTTEHQSSVPMRELGAWRKQVTQEDYEKSLLPEEEEVTE